MTPYEFGRLVKLSVAPFAAPTMWGAAPPQGPAPERVMPGPGASILDPSLLPPTAPPPPRVAAPRVMPGPGPSTIDPSLLAPPAPRPAAPVAAPRVMPGPTAATFSPPEPKPQPRPTAAKPAPAQPKPTAPGVRKPAGRIA